MTRHTTTAVAVALSKGRLRTELGNPLPMPAAAEAVPFTDPKTGRITDGKAAAKRSAEKRKLLREIREASEPIATMNPETCPVWLREHVREGAPYAMTLRERFPDPALARLVGTTVDAYVLYRAHAALGAKGDAKAMTEARAWHREHRASLRELAALAGLVKAGPPTDPHAAFYAAAREAEAEIEPR